MYGKKIFGIGAVALLMILSISPLVNSLNVKTEAPINDKIKDDEIVPCFQNCDLEIIFIECQLSYTVPLSRPEDWDKYSHAYYKIYYSIKNHNNSYSGNVKLTFTTIEMGENTVVWSWIENINLDNSASIDLTYDSTEILCHWDPEIDEERYIAGKFVSLRLDPLNGNDSFMDNNIDYGAVKSWKDNENYEPTEPEILVITAHNYMNITIPGTDLWYYNFPFEEDVIPVLMKNRLGYIWELTTFIHEINKLSRQIIRNFIDLIILVKDDVKIVLYWIEEVLVWIASIVNGNPIPCGVLELLINYFKYVRPALDRIKEQVDLWLNYELIELVQKLIDLHNEFEQWMNSEPWKLPITVELTVVAKNKNDRITVACRDDSDTGIGKKTYHFQLEVSSLWSGEQYYWTPKDCTVVIESHPGDGERHTPKLFSYAFSNGTIRFPTPIYFPICNIMNSMIFGNPLFEKILNSGTILKSLIDKFFSFYSLKFLNQNQPKNDYLNDKINTINFNLDNLMKNVLEEEENFEINDKIEYKKYYPNAPKDPNIVYYSSDQVIIGFKSYVDITNINEVEGYPVVDKIVELNTVVVEIYAIEPEEFIEIVEQLDDVEYAELNYVYQTCFIPNDPKWDQQWNMRAINCPQAWNTQKGNSFVTIAIIDTGVCYNHEDKNAWMKNGHDFVNDDDDPMDDCYITHGTHCAGIATAQIDNRIGIAGIADVWVLPVKVLDEYGAGYATDIAKGIIYAAVQYDVNIISMSLGGYGLSVLLHLACDFAYYFSDILIVAAAGNDGLSILCYPARFSSVISVGAVDSNLNLCSWSNHGPNLDLVAPGEDILSTVGYNEYSKLSGTSMATPHVAGVAALYFSNNWDDLAIKCKAKLFGTAINLGSDCGHGLVNAYGAVKKNKFLINYNFPILNKFFLLLKNYLSK